MQGPKWPFLLRYASRDTRRIDFPQLMGSQRTPGFGASQLGIRVKVNDYFGSSMGVFISMVLIAASQLGIRA